MNRSFIVITLVALLAVAGPVFAGSSKDKAVDAKDVALLLENVEVKTTALDDGVEVVFKTKDKEIIEQLDYLISNGHLFSPGSDGAKLVRRMKKSRRGLTLTVTSDSAAGIEHAQQVARTLEGDGRRIQRAFGNKRST